MYPPFEDYIEIIKLELNQEQKEFLDLHKICISDGYLGMLRAYKDNKTIWQSGGALDVMASNIREDFDGWLDESSLNAKNKLHKWLNKLMALPADLLEKELKCQYSFLTGGKYQD